uniref:F5/8 type C domain-containing protein n=1 Tax=Periophthalmus magnuspinnatus TaxID=409849 RepID=A0A3B3ZGI2_9GOBI
GVKAKRIECGVDLYSYICQGELCMLGTELRRECDEPLASPLSHTAFTSSSVFSNGYAPGYAKLNRRGGTRPTPPTRISSRVHDDHYQWLQVDFGSRKQVSAIATQGRYSSSDWTTRYRLLYSDTGRNWKPYHQDGNIWFPEHFSGEGGKKGEKNWQFSFQLKSPSPNRVINPVVMVVQLSTGLFRELFQVYSARS